MSERGWSLRYFREGDEEGILDCLNAAFGRWPGVDIDVPAIDHLRWKLSGGPSDLQYVVADGSTIVGGRIVLAQRFALRGRVLDSCSFVDLMVHPGRRTRGVMRAIWEASLASGAEAFDMSIGFARHPDVQRYMRNTGMKPIANRVELLERDMAPAPRSGGLRISSLERFEPRWDQFFEEASQSFDFILRRTAEYLNWRFADRRAGRFRILAVEEGERPLGYTVLTMARGKALLADLLVLPGHDDVLRALIETALECAASEEVTSLRCWSTLHHRYRAALERAGFRTKRPVEGLLIVPFGETKLDRLFEDEDLAVHVCIGDTDVV